jgi:hypothetical protein
MDFLKAELAKKKALVKKSIVLTSSLKFKEFLIEKTGKV